MFFRYVILGAGRQGIATAHDLIRHGEASTVLLADSSEIRLREGAEVLRRLSPSARVETRVVDATNERAVIDAISGANAVVSAVPHFLNLAITRAAIGARTNLCDLGGNTDVVKAQHDLTETARKAGVRIVPDCGLAPGLNNTLSVYAMGLLDQPRDVRSYCGGLPQSPQGPLLYSIAFSMHGLLGEYSGTAYYLRDGRVTPVPAFTEPESIESPIGKLEAFVTSGGTSTAPWTFEGKLDRYEYKTLRYPGHYERMRAIIDLGLVDTQPVRVGQHEVVPRELFFALAVPKLDHGRVADVVIQRVVARGQHRGRDASVTIDLVDRYDSATGFTAMERTTGFSTAIVCHALARGETPAGVVPLETAIDAKKFVEAFRSRGFDLRIEGPTDLLQG